MQLRGLVVLSLSSAAVAQSLTLTSLATSPLVATTAANVQTASLPAGPMLPNGSVNASSLSSVATTFYWNSSTSDVEMYFGLVQYGVVLTAGAAAGNGPIDLQVDLIAPQVMPVRIELARSIMVPAGGPGPLLRVDVGNDGIFELTETGSVLGNQPWVSVDAQIGPTPLPVRVQMSMAATAVGSVENVLNAHVRPRTGLTIDTTVVGCASTEWYWLRPTFAGNLNAYAQSATSPVPLMVAVLGLGTQPLLLGGTLVPCLVLPSPDLLLPIVPSSVIGGPASPAPVFTLSIPPGIGPWTLWTQAVVVEPANLTTTTALRVAAP